MKEFENKDLQGLETVSMPRQLDEFEASGALALGTRSIFDFSTELSSRMDLQAGSSRYVPLWLNAVLSDDIYDTAKGAPGHATLMVDKQPIWKNSPNYFPNGQILDITNKYQIPYWNEDAIIYLDESRSDLYYSGLVRNNPNYVREFRSGYIELTFKTDKQNCVIGVGTVKKTNYNTSSNATYTGNSEAEETQDFLFGDNVSVINADSAYLSDGYTNSHSLYIKLVDGKINIEYFDDFGPNKKEFSILGNQNVADNNWHHVVLNFGKPGIIRQGEKRFSERFIEIWVDGKLDKRTKEYVNNSQVYFPVIDWLLMDPLAIDPNLEQNFWQNLWPTLVTNGEMLSGSYGAGTSEYTHQHWRKLTNREFDNAKPTAFRGAINHYVAGVNAPLDKNEIKNRYRLYIGNEKDVDILIASAKMIEPTISSNKKKALKLFWNNLVSENAKDGLELDNTFDIYTYSITHKIKNSASEIYNIDKSISRKINYLPDVRVALKDNVFLFGPGKESLYNRSEVWNAAAFQEQWQLSATNFNFLDAINTIGTDFAVDTKSRFSSYAINNLLFSGIQLNTGDRILLTNQINRKENGIYIFNGLNKPLERDENSRSPQQINNGIVRVTDGYYKNTSWTLSNTIVSLNDSQDWIELESHPTEDDINSQPIFTQRWTEENGEERFIDLQQDLNINNYNIITFMNYPETNEEIKEHFIGYNDFEITEKYNNFIKSLKTVVANGAKLYVSSPRLATDLGVVKTFTEVPQLLQSADAAAASLSPFELGEPAERYFDTHRNNKYKVATTLAGLTNKETYLLTDFINFTPESEYDFDQYHAKYSYRQFGLQEGNEFIIPGTALRKVTEKDDLPGYKQNQIGTKPLMAVEPQNILAGTVITQLANTYYNNSTVTNNPYDDYATTIVVHNGQLLGETPITGKIFVNCIEDGYTFSREEYNKAVIQTLPQTDVNETTATRAWQYSTTRLDRKPQRINVSGLTTIGQTTPTSGGGGALIQAPSNSSNGIIRSVTDKNNVNYQSDLYPTQEEEIYPLQEIPVLSMTYLGLQWLAG